MTKLKKPINIKRELFPHSKIKRKTKAFSCTMLEWKVFERNAREAKKNGRSESQQIIHVLNEFFLREEMIKKLNQPAKENSLAGGKPCDQKMISGDIPKSAMDGFFASPGEGKTENSATVI